MHRLWLLPWLFLSSCWPERPLPPIAAGLPSNVSQAQAEFNRRIVHAFPIGTPVAVVRSRLSAQGFDVGLSGAELRRAKFPCETHWGVGWKAKAGKLTDVDGVFGLACT